MFPLSVEFFYSQLVYVFLRPAVIPDINCNVVNTLLFLMDKDKKSSRVYEMDEKICFFFIHRLPS
jgi:hypothetical protein